MSNSGPAPSWKRKAGFGCQSSGPGVWNRVSALAGVPMVPSRRVRSAVWMPAPSEESRGVRGIDVYVRSDAAQLAGLVERVDRGELVVDVAERVGLAELPSVHARAATGSVARSSDAP